jgi:hypothetical protein
MPSMTDTSALGTPPILQRLMARRAERSDVARCEFCAEAIGGDHRHVADTEQRSIRCACRGCSLLFVGTVDARYRAVPDRHGKVEPFVLDPVAWSRMQIPVGLVFFMTAGDRVSAFYPGPAGATESELSLDEWEQIVIDNPVLAGMEPDVEAALVRMPGRHLGSTTGEPTCHVVPIDRCYELIGLMRLHWRGFDGGEESRQALESFLDDVGSRATPLVETDE